MVRCVWAMFFLLWVTLVTAVEYRIPVANPQLFDTDAEIKRVIVQLSESMTGLPQSAMEVEAPDLFALSEALVNSYGFGDSEFIVDLDQLGLKARLQSAGIELWEGDRPEFLIWATEERGLERVMIGIEPNPIVDQLLEDGRRFSIPMRRPLMDLDDTLALSAAEIWGGFEGAVEQASRRYNASHILVVGDRPERFTLRFWLIDSEGQIKSGEVSGKSAEERVEQITIILLQHARSINLPDNLVASRTPNSVLPSGIATDKGEWFVQVQYEEMLKLMDLVDYLDSNDQISIREMVFEPGAVRLRIVTKLTLEQTDRIMTGFESLSFVEPLAYALN